MNASVDLRVHTFLGASVVEREIVFKFGRNGGEYAFPVSAHRMSGIKLESRWDGAITAS